MRVAMVCLGNICRSPMAAMVARAMAEEAGIGAEVTIESFGTSGYHAGEGADPGALAALRRRGWPAGTHRARRLTRADVAAADLVLCADRANVAEVTRIAGEAATADIRLLRSFDPAAAGEGVPDPWGGADADFDEALEAIERACRGLVATLAGARR